MKSVHEKWREQKAAEAEAARNAATAERIEALVSSVAAREEGIATRAHAEGDLFLIDGMVYRATDVIGRGERIDGSNSKSVTIADVIAEIKE